MERLVHPVVISGGSGNRLWPASRNSKPKQFLSFQSEFSLLQNTVLRTSNFADHTHPLVVCGAEHCATVAEDLRRINCTASRIVVEPLGRNTAPAAAVAALWHAERDPQALLLLLPADHIIQDAAALHSAIQSGMGPAADGMLVTFGVHPDRPETGYGYIELGSAINDFPGCHAVSKFVEKPDKTTAQRLISTGDHAWNSGIFLFRADSFLNELEIHASAVVAACQRALDTSESNADYLVLGEAAFADCPAISIDYAVMERTKRAVVVPVQMGWSDVGSWASLWQIQNRDSDGNVMSGSTVSINTSNSYVRSDGPLVATIGLDGMVVIATKDAVLVCPMEKAQEVVHIVELINRDGGQFKD